MKENPAYVQFLRDHPSAIDLCRLLLASDKPLSPTEVAQRLDLSVQTTSNALIQLKDVSPPIVTVDDEHGRDRF